MLSPDQSQWQFESARARHFGTKLGTAKPEVGGVGGLAVRLAPHRPERRGHIALDPLPQDIEIELEPCYGLSGLIRARAASITFEPGEPDEQNG